MFLVILLKIRTTNLLQVAKIFLFNKLVTNIVRSMQIFYEFFWNNEKN